MFLVLRDTLGLLRGESSGADGFGDGIEGGLHAYIVLENRGFRQEATQIKSDNYLRKTPVLAGVFAGAKNTNILGTVSGCFALPVTRRLQAAVRLPSECRA